MIDHLAAAVISLCSTSSLCPDVFETPHGARVLVHAVNDASREHRVDTQEMLALCWDESRFGPGELSERGAVGICQVLTRYWPYPSCSDATYRCLRAQAGAGAKAFSHYRRLCGSLPSAIRAYRTGRCGKPVATTRRVLRALARIRRSS